MTHAANPGDMPKPDTITRQNVAAGDVVIRGDEIRRLVEQGVLDSPGEIIPTLAGRLGVHGYNVAPSDDEAKLLPYGREKDGHLGVMSHAEFSERLLGLGIEESPVEAPARTAKVWQVMLEASIKSAEILNNWGNPSFLRRELGQLHEKIAARRHTRQSEDRRLADLRREIIARLTGEEKGVPPSATLPVIGRPFMMVELPEIDEPKPIDEQPLSKQPYIDMDALYEFLVATEGAATGNLGDTRPQVIQMVNARITEPKAPIPQ